MKILFSVLFLSLSLVTHAQEKGDSVSKDQEKIEMNVSISVEDLSRLENEKKQAVQNSRSLLQSYNQLRQQDSVNTRKLKEIELKYNSLKMDYEAMVKSQKNANDKLVNIASNFLYIPYEAYSIQRIAIPAFTAVTDPQLIQKYQVKLALLENYQKDIEGVLLFISAIEKELGNIFAKDLKSLNRQFEGTDFYLRYSQYGDWENTYLGKKLKYIDVKMKSYNGGNKPDFTSIKKELNQCLESVKSL